MERIEFQTATAHRPSNPVLRSSGIDNIPKGDSGNVARRAKQTSRFEAERVSVADANIPELVQKADRLVESLSTKISFAVDARSGEHIIIVSEKETGKIIRKIPPEEMLRLAAKMEEISGIIFHRTI